MPFGSDLDFADTYRMSTYRGTISGQGGVVEPYMPDRVLRQFGRVQGRPQPVIPAIDPQRSSNPFKPYKLTFDNVHDRWESDDADRFYDIGGHQPTSADCPGGVTADYLQWFDSEFRGYVLQSTPRIPQPAPVHPPPAPLAPPAPSLFVDVQTLMARGDLPDFEDELVELLRRRGRVIL